MNSIKTIFGADASQFHAVTRQMDQGVQGIEKNITGSFNKIGASIAGAFTIGAATSFFREIASVTKEIQTMADTAGIGAERLQRIAQASQTVNVSQEKFADILKDVNDKFGDFIQTGAGPMADFFEFIAPKVNLTADSFKNLTSDQILIKYVKALQDANLSQADMTFYMEAIASDSTKLLPLLQNNAKALEDIADAANGVFTAEQIAAVNRADAAFSQLGTTIKVFSGGILADLIQSLELGKKAFEGFSLAAGNPFNIAASAEIKKVDQALTDFFYQLDIAIPLVDKKLKEFFGDLDKQATEAQWIKVGDQIVDMTAKVDAALETTGENVIKVGDRFVKLPAATAPALAEIEAQVKKVDAALTDFFGDLDKQSQTGKYKGKGAAAAKGGGSKSDTSAPTDGGKATPSGANTPAGTPSDPVTVQVTDPKGKGGSAGLTAMSILPGGIVPGGADINQLVGLARSLEQMQSSGQQFAGNWRYTPDRGVNAGSQAQMQRDLDQIVKALNDVVKLQGGNGIIGGISARGGNITGQLIDQYTRAMQTTQQMMGQQEQLLRTIANNTRKGY